MAKAVFYAHTMPGVEDIAWLEIRKLIPYAQFVDKLFAKERNGIVMFEHDGPIQPMLGLRTTEDLFLMALSLDKISRGWKDLYQLTKLIARRAEFKDAVDQLMQFQRDNQQSGIPTYRIVRRTYGRYEFQPKDLERSIEKGIKARYPHWKLVNDEHARIEVWVNILGTRLIIGLRLTDHTMSQRFKKVKQLKTALRPSIAAAMIHLTEPDSNDVFLDPMSGSGTLLMERRMAGPYQQLLGGDNNLAHAQFSDVNVSRMRKERPSSFTIHHLNGKNLPFADGSIDKVATQLPFGHHNRLARLYPPFFAELARVLKENGRAVIFSSEYDLLKDAVRKQPKLTTLTGYSISTKHQWGRIYIIRRDP